MLGDALPLQILEYHVRPPVVDPTVEDLSNVRMLQLSQNLALRLESPSAVFWIADETTEYLDCDLLLELAVCPLG